MLQSMRLQKVTHDFVTEQQKHAIVEIYYILFIHSFQLMGFWVAATFMDTMNNTAVRTCVQIFLWICVLFLSFLSIFIEVWLIYNVVLISTVQQSDSYIYTHTHILF